jgi:hypothetical protein
MYKDGYSIRRIPEVVAHSGSALLHFYSDVAYNMTGFNISYRWVIAVNGIKGRVYFNPCMIVLQVCGSHMIYLSHYGSHCYQIESFP